MQQRLLSRWSQATPRAPMSSELWVIGWFKSVVVETLGYDFFNRGFEAILLRIEETLDDPQAKFYAMFFLGCAAFECGNETPLRVLVEDIGAKRLPLPISFAIQCELESKTNLDKDGLLRFHKDKLRKLLVQKGKTSAAGNMATRSQINDLFEKPLSSRKVD